MNYAKKTFLLTIALFLLAGCGSSSPVPITELSDIVGTWKSDPHTLVIRILPDGTVLSDTTVVNINEGARWEYSFSFVEGQLLMGDNYATYAGCQGESGTYDVQLHSNGNLEFNVAEDDCIFRVAAFMGQQVEPVFDIEWIKVE